MKKWRLVTYDIREPGRLRRVAKTLEGYGERLQYSVFRIHTTDRDFEKLRWELTRIATEEDSVIYFSLCPACARRIESHENLKPIEWPDDSEHFHII
ncbi:MAG: CRISPR-associated endonuclease Cas2 [Leptospiraceae bacterium]|nr:CRISPR-associated endonuclease Cas2 [Leptospiraceae bacterium]